MSIQEQTYLLQAIIKRRGMLCPAYEFLLDDKPVAVLKKKGLGSKAELTIGARQWHIRLRGFRKNHIEINDIQYPALNTRCEGGRYFRLYFTLQNGKKFYFKRKSAWKSAWLWLDEYEQPVMEMKFVHFNFSCSGKVNFYQPANGDLYFLMLLGWYRLLQYQAIVAASAGGAS